MTDASRPPPSNLEAEQALLGAILVNNDAYHIVSGFLQARHFSQPVHGAVYKALAVTIGQGRKATPATLSRALAGLTLTGPAAEGFSLQGYVARLAAEAVTIVNATDYARVILELSVERDILALTARAGEAIGTEAVEAQLSAIEDGVAEIRRDVQRQSGGGAIRIGEGAEILRERADDVLQGKTVIPSTGLADLDERLAGGCWPGRLIVVAGRPGMGKTCLLTEIARRIARSGLDAKREEERFASGIVTLEIDASEVTARVLAGEIARSDMPLPYRDIMTGKFEDERDMHRFRAALPLIKDFPLYIEYAPGATLMEITGRVRFLKERARREGYRLVSVAVDYLGLVAPSERYRGNPVQEIGEIALGLKRLAETEEVTLWLGCQLNRSVEERDDKRPDLPDLRGSGNIEEHSDAVLMLYREAYYIERSKKMREGDPDTMQRALDRKYQMEILIPKNRMGQPGTVKAFADVAQSRIDDKARGDFNER